MKNYYQGNSEHPQHLSIGAVLINDKNEVCCHKFNKENLKGYWVDEGLDNLYLLMRETIEPEERIEEALHRGLIEEFGATAKLIDYIGSIQSEFKHKDTSIQKTTLYFLCKLKEQDLSKRSKADIEGTTDIEWKTIDFLISVMNEQEKKFGRSDVNESSILERVRERLGKL